VFSKFAVNEEFDGYPFLTSFLAKKIRSKLQIIKIMVLIGIDFLQWIPNSQKIRTVVLLFFGD